MGMADNSTKPCSVGTLGHVGKTSTHEEQNQELYILADLANGGKCKRDSWEDYFYRDRPVKILSELARATRLPTCQSKPDIRLLGQL